ITCGSLPAALVPCNFFVLAVYVADALDNPISGVPVTITADNPDVDDYLVGADYADGKTIGDGTYYLGLASVLAGTQSLLYTAVGLSDHTDSVTFVPGPPTTANSIINLTPSGNISTDSGNKVTINI